MKDIVRGLLVFLLLCLVAFSIWINFAYRWSDFKIPMTEYEMVDVLPWGEDMIDEDGHDPLAPEGVEKRETLGKPSNEALERNMLNPNRDIEMWYPIA